MIERRARRFALSLALVAFAAVPLWAGQGNVPVYEPMVITSPGHYILTRDISATSGPVFEIHVDGVTLNGNGHTIALSDATVPVIKINDAAVGSRSISIVGAKIRGGLHGIDAHPPDPVHLSLQDLKIEGAADAAVKADNLGSLQARGIIIVGGKTGFDLMGHPPDPNQPWRPTAMIAGVSIQGAEEGVSCNGVTCEITNSLISSCGSSVGLAEAEGSVVRSNGFGPPGSEVCFSPKPEPPGIWIKASAGVQVVGNTIRGLTIPSGQHHGIFVDESSYDVFIADNTITGFGDDGIHLLAENGYVMNNLLARNDNGVFVGGVNHLIDDNKIGANTANGIHFGTGGHVYRNNVLRGNPGGGIGGETDNTDGGNNIQ